MSVGGSGMKMCLTCRMLWPRDARLCGRCGRSFGGRLCPRWHLSPPGATCCVHCGETRLTQPASGLSLGCLVPALVVLASLLGAALVWRQCGPALAAGAFQVVLMAGAAWIGMALIPGQLGRDLRRGASRLLGGVWRLLLFGAVWRGLRDLVLGRDRTRYH